MLKLSFILFLFANPSFGFHILIDPGHGGRDRGAQVQQITEVEIIEPWTLALKRELTKLGFRVSLTRQENQAPPSIMRKQMYKDSRFDLIISLHANYFFDPKVKGIEYFIKNPLNLEDQSLKLASEEKSKSLTQVIVEDLKNQAHLRKSYEIAKKLESVWSGRIKQGSFDVLDLSNAPSVLIELGYLSNPTDLAKLKNPEFIGQQTARFAKSISSVFDLKGPVF